MEQFNFELEISELALPWFTKKKQEKEIFFKSPKILICLDKSFKNFNMIKKNLFSNKYYKKEKSKYLKIVEKISFKNEIKEIKNFTKKNIFYEHFLNENENENLNDMKILIDKCSFLLVLITCPVLNDDDIECDTIVCYTLIPIYQLYIGQKKNQTFTFSTSFEKMKNFEKREKIYMGKIKIIVNKESFKFKTNFEWVCKNKKFSSILENENKINLFLNKYLKYHENISRSFLEKQDEFLKKNFNTDIVSKSISIQCKSNSNMFGYFIRDGFILTDLPNYNKLFFYNIFLTCFKIFLLQTEYFKKIKLDIKDIYSIKTIDSLEKDKKNYKFINSILLKFSFAKLIDLFKFFLIFLSASFNYLNDMTYENPDDIIITDVYVNITTLGCGDCEDLAKVINLVFDCVKDFTFIDETEMDFFLPLVIFNHLSNLCFNTITLHRTRDNNVSNSTLKDYNNKHQYLNEILIKENPIINKLIDTTTIDACDVSGHMNVVLILKPQFFEYLNRNEETKFKFKKIFETEIADYKKDSLNFLDFLKKNKFNYFSNINIEQFELLLRKRFTFSILEGTGFYFIPNGNLNESIIKKDCYNCDLYTLHPFLKKTKFMIYFKENNKKKFFNNVMSFHLDYFLKKYKIPSTCFYITYFTKVNNKYIYGPSFESIKNNDNELLLIESPQQTIDETNSIFDSGKLQLPDFDFSLNEIFYYDFFNNQKINIENGNNFLTTGLIINDEKNENEENENEKINDFFLKIKFFFNKKKKKKINNSNNSNFEDYNLIFPFKNENLFYYEKIEKNFKKLIENNINFLNDFNFFLFDFEISKTVYVVLNFKF